jgi:transposase
VTLGEEVARLRAENAELRVLIADLRDTLAADLARIAELEEQLKQKRPDPPAFVKPNRPKREKPAGARKKRAPQHNTSRRRETPTRIERHALDHCPECSYPLTGDSVDYTRQVIELPPPQPVDITEHQVIKRKCPHCDQWRAPHLDLRGTVIGQGRIGVRIAGLIAYLRTTLRMTVIAIQTYLQGVHRLRISTGEIVELLHDVAQATQPAVDALREQMRTSPVLHADETGWREDGQNGYAWVFATPGEHGIRYYERDRSRGQAVVRRIVAPVEGQRSPTCLVSDFYCGYNDYAGPHQRCWVHLLRDLHDLKEDHASDDAVLTWARGVRQMYDDAHAWLKAHAQATDRERTTMYEYLMGRAVALGRQYAKEREHPCNALAKRLLRHQDELFQFAVRDGVASDNNLAERAVRPLVVMRKISGGSRSPRGSSTRFTLATLFGTWQVRGLNPFAECVRLLSQPSGVAAQTALPQP